MPCKIYLRHDQSIKQRELYSSEKVTIFAPIWVKGALNTLADHLNGTKFEVYDEHNRTNENDSVTITNNFNDQSLRVLEMIARNEPSNVTGVINTTLYMDIANKPEVLFSIRDLVRQCVIVGVDECSHYGGYHTSRLPQPKQRVYACDLAALQFQQRYNTGRLVLIQYNDEFRGVLDDVIYENVVGEKKRSYADIANAWEQSQSNDEEIKQRYLRHDGYGIPGRGSCFLDKKAYAAFVKKDVILYGLALQKVVSRHHPDDQIHFKFLKYGTGFFGGKFATILSELILHAVLDGLDELLNKPKVLDMIKQIELPFFQSKPDDEERLQEFQSKFGIEVLFTKDDALKASQVNGLILSTTNCGDNHAVFGKSKKCKINFFGRKLNQTIFLRQ